MGQCRQCGNSIPHRPFRLQTGWCDECGGLRTVHVLFLLLMFAFSFYLAIQVGSAVGHGIRSWNVRREVADSIGGATIVAIAVSGIFASAIAFAVFFHRPVRADRSKEEQRKILIDSTVSGMIGGVFLLVRFGLYEMWVAGIALAVYFALFGFGFGLAGSRLRWQRRGADARSRSTEDA